MTDKRSFMFVGIAVCPVLVVVDITSDSLVLIPLLVLAPLITCSGGTPRGHPRRRRCRDRRCCSARGG